MSDTSEDFVAARARHRSPSAGASSSEGSDWAAAARVASHVANEENATITSPTGTNADQADHVLPFLLRGD